MVPTLSVGIQTFRNNINYEEKKVFLFGIVCTGGIENPWKYQVSKGFCFYNRDDKEDILFNQ